MKKLLPILTCSTYCYLYMVELCKQARRIDMKRSEQINIFYGKRIKAIATVSVMIVFASVSPLVNATGCGSLATVTSDIWSKFGGVAIAAGCAVGAETADMDFFKCYKDITTYNNMAKSMTAYWNTQVDSSWKKIGPRPLTDKWQSGTLVSTFGRVWTSQLPANSSKLTVKIKKLDFKAETGVAVCVTDKKGKTTKLKEHTFSKGKDNIGNTWTYVINNAMDKISSVHLDDKSAVKKFKYEIKAE